MPRGCSSHVGEWVFKAVGPGPCLLLNSLPQLCSLQSCSPLPSSCSILPHKPQFQAKACTLEGKWEPLGPCTPPFPGPHCPPPVRAVNSKRSDSSWSLGSPWGTLGPAFLPPTHPPTASSLYNPSPAPTPLGSTWHLQDRSPVGLGRVLELEPRHCRCGGLSPGTR